MGLTSAQIRRWEALPGFAELAPKWVRRTVAEWVVIAENLTKQHGGILPNPCWLQKHYKGLDHALRKQPRAFAHLKQDKKFKTVAEWVTVAEDLARKHHGRLPHSWWLQNHGYRTLLGAVRTHPQAFRHIKQDYKQKTLEAQVAIAEGLAKKNHGILQNTGWLQHNGYGGLSQVMYKQPRAFRHIKQLKLDRSGKPIK